MHRLFVVKALLEIRQRGVVVAGTVDNPEDWFHVGDTVEIRRAGAVVSRAAISGIGVSPPGITTNLLLKGIAKTNVAEGDEVWISEKGPSE